VILVVGGYVVAAVVVFVVVVDSIGLRISAVFGCFLVLLIDNLCYLSFLEVHFVYCWYYYYL
jgi:hypothetical protein